VQLERPVFRRLRVFAVDPETAARIDLAAINEVTLFIPWEVDATGQDILEKGPRGEYVEVVDEDEQGTRLNEPVDLNDPLLLATDGLIPSDSHPQFRQQMVYAVAMRVIAVFEAAFGRRVHWPQTGAEYCRRLKMYPNYTSMLNAYFDTAKGGLVFGSFVAAPPSPIAGTTVYTSLSQDVIAFHLAGLLASNHVFTVASRELTAENPDIEAFSRGFGDLVALLLHFSLPELLRHQIALTRGDLAAGNYLGALANQFALALGSQAGVRNAFGDFDSQNVWRPAQPDVASYREGKVKEPHERGLILLRAVFDAFQTIYRERITDLIRIASDGSGILPQGELHPELVHCLAREAAKSARQVLDMCVRALDYCPAVNVRFSDFLRAILTADVDLQPVDVRNYRVAFVQAFRRYGLLPEEVGTLSVDSMLWPRPTEHTAGADVVKLFTQTLARDYSAWDLPTDREQLYRWTLAKADLLTRMLLEKRANLDGVLGAIDPQQAFRVNSIRSRERVGPDGEPVSQWVIQIVQATAGKTSFNASCTLIVDASTGQTRWIVSRSCNEAKPYNIRSTKPGAANRMLPHERRLRVFALDPSMDTRVETAAINQVTLRIPWEPVEKGPVGTYLEVIDRDPASGCFYEPVDLNAAYLLATDGHAPSQSRPQFHQQMVYAVAMRTIRNFEQALGRVALWSPRQPNYTQEDSQATRQDEFVETLRLYPHAIREANAFYSPARKAILFGYFDSTFDAERALTTVFTCLSHDIIAHEVTHALLDGMHRRFAEPSNPDVLAFHEAFADIVALFQHFSIPEVLTHQIAVTRGDLASQNRLGELAQEFGSAIGNHGALRNALGEIDPATRQWRPRAPDPQAYRKEMEPHARGALLVATIFDAFVSIYRARVAGLLRIATKGSGLLPAGLLHPDLVKRLAREAAKVAQHLLDMCIRALDYCPPVDITFGDYLRALITADVEYDPTDSEHRRTAIIEAFRRHGITPEDVRSMSQEGLLWRQARASPGDDENVVLTFVQDWNRELSSWNLSSDRETLFNMMRDKRAALHDYLDGKKRFQKLDIIDPAYKFEVHSLRPSKRIDWQGRAHYQWVIEITQRRMLPLTEGADRTAPEAQSFCFRGGATLLVDAASGRVRYIIRKRMDSAVRMARQRAFLRNTPSQSLYATYSPHGHEEEPFAVLHRR
jgi:hypothetical protein